MGRMVSLHVLAHITACSWRTNKEELPAPVVGGEFKEHLGMSYDMKSHSEITQSTWKQVDLCSVKWEASMPSWDTQRNRFLLDASRPCQALQAAISYLMETLPRTRSWAKQQILVLIFFLGFSSWSCLWVLVLILYIYTHIYTYIYMCIYIYMFEKNIHAWVLCFWNLKHLTKMRKWSCPFFTVQRRGHWNMCTLTITLLDKFGNLTYEYGIRATCTRFLQPNHGNQ